MTVSVEASNLGPLRSAEVEVADLTLLIGENNTGKTFLATLIHRILSASAVSLSRPFRSRGPDLGDLPIQIQDWVDHHQIRSDNSPPLPDNPWLAPTHDTLEWAVRFTESLLLSFGSDIRGDVGYAFGRKVSELRRATLVDQTEDCYLRVSNTEPNWVVEIRFDSDDIVVSPPDPEAWLKSILDVEDIWVDLVFSPNKVYRRWISSLFVGWPQHAVHLPAGRTGLVDTWSVLASSIVRGPVAMGVRGIDIESLPGTLRDLLTLIFILLNRSRSNEYGDPRIQALVRRFEDRIGGSIEFSDGSGLESNVVARLPEGVFPLAQASSMFSDLAPMLLIVKSDFSRGDVLVIDEPEAHLHPKVQRFVASFFADLVNYGVRIVLTTHSDFLLGEINNLIRNGILARQQGILPMGRSLELMISNIRALQFTRDDRGCKGETLDISPIDGIDERTFTDIMESLYDESAQLINRLIEETSASDDD